MRGAEWEKKERGGKGGRRKGEVDGERGGRTEIVKEQRNGAGERHREVRRRGRGRGRETEGERESQGGGEGGSAISCCVWQCVCDTSAPQPALIRAGLLSDTGLRASLLPMATVSKEISFQAPPPNAPPCPRH